MHPASRRRWIRSCAPALAAAVLAFAACAKPVEEELLVSPGSPILDGLATMPAGADPSTLFEAREIFRLAHRGDAVAALDLHLERLALAALADTPPPAAATIGDILNRAPAADEAAAVRADRARVLRSSLAAQSLAPAGLEVAVEVRNATSRLVTGFQGALVFMRDGKVVAGMPCAQKTAGPVRLGPGAALPHLCSFTIPRSEVEQMLREPATATSGWHFEAAAIRFDDPRVSVSANGVHWHDAEEAGVARARRWLGEVGCERRGVCGQEDALHRWWKHPAAPGMAASAFAGLVVGVLCALFRPRRLRVAIIVSAALLAAVAALATGAGGPGDAGYILLWLLFYGPVFLLPYFVVLLATLAVAGVLARRKAPAQAAPTPVE